MAQQTEQTEYYELRNRYVFKGKLVMQTAFHIGGGRVTLSNSDSPVVLTPEEHPFIPGSSFKGALRSTVEKIASSLPGNWYSCALIELSREDGWQEKDRRAKEKERPICPTVWSEDIKKERREKPARTPQILAEARDRLCDTCKLFGSPFVASRININDLYLSDKVWDSIIQIRDGVAIDRDSEKAKDRLKYDFEVVPASVSFDLAITLENATQRDLQLIGVGLSEFVHGFGVIGGKRSRGLGVCKLEQLHVAELELIGTGIEKDERNRRLRDYLRGKKFSNEFSDEAAEEFLKRCIDTIFAQ
jgi:CRISPR-associated RAMP protein (TIGR02581 family)